MFGDDLSLWWCLVTSHIIAAAEVVGIRLHWRADVQPGKSPSVGPLRGPLYSTMVRRYSRADVDQAVAVEVASAAAPEADVEPP